MDDSDLTRRRFLAACGVALGSGAAGCNASPFGGGDDSNERDDGPDRPRPGGGTGDRVDPLTPAGTRSGQYDRFGQSGQQLSNAHATVYEEAIPSIGQIQVYTSNSSGSGTGWVFRDDYVVTNHHVVENAESIWLRFSDSGWIEGTVVGSDIYSDLAVVSVPDLPQSANGLPLSRTDPAVGTEVVAIGNPFGFSGSVSSGIVSGVDRAIEGPNNFSIPDAIQTDAPVNPGNSGGPLVTLSGNVVGVINSGGGDNIGFAISAAMVERVAPALIEDGNYEHSYMGVEIQDVTLPLARANGLDDARGVYVHDVVDGTPSAGVLQGSTGQRFVDGQTVDVGGDVIRSLAGQPIPNREALSRVLALYASPGDTVDVGVIRDGRLQSVRLTLGARPSP